MKRPLTDVAHDVAVPLLWMDEQVRCLFHEQGACDVCAECEVTTQRVRMLDAVNSGQYEENE